MRILDISLYYNTHPYRAFRLVVRSSFVFPAATVIGRNKSRDLYQPITVAAYKNKRKIELQVESLHREKDTYIHVYN